MEQCDLADKKAKVPRLSTIDVGVPQPTIADQVPVDAAAKKPGTYLNCNHVHT